MHERNPNIWCMRRPTTHQNRNNPSYDQEQICRDGLNNDRQYFHWRGSLTHRLGYICNNSLVYMNKRKEHSGRKISNGKCIFGRIQNIQDRKQIKRQAGDRETHKEAITWSLLKPTGDVMTDSVWCKNNRTEMLLPLCLTVNSSSDAHSCVYSFSKHLIIC